MKSTRHMIMHLCIPDSIKSDPLINHINTLLCLYVIMTICNYGFMLLCFYVPENTRVSSKTKSLKKKSPGVMRISFGCIGLPRLKFSI